MQTSRSLRVAWILTSVLFLVQYLPYLLRSDGYIRIHDTLEGEWMWYAAIVDAGLAMSYDMGAMVDAWMGGIPRYLFPPGLSITTLLIFLFGTIKGYVVSSLIIDLTAFAGCYLLFSRYVFTKETDRHWAVLVGALFSITPFFATFGISIAGLPLLTVAFLDILNNRASLWHYLVIVIFPFYSNIVWSAPFINIMLVALVAITYRKQYNLTVFFGMLFLMDALYLAANVHLIHAMFFSDLALHRESYDPLAGPSLSFGRAMGETAFVFFANHYHIGTMVNLPILLLGLLAWKRKSVRILLGGALSIALLNGFYLWLVPALERIHPMIISFRISRVKMLLPFIWIAILAFSILQVSSADTRGRRVSWFVMGCMFISTLFANDEVLNNYRNWLGFQKKPDAGEFFAAGLWEDIGSHIGREKSAYRVAHLGLNPAISQYNGFHTIDGLQAVYPLQHKEFMGEVMKEEFAKDEKLARYFTSWGNRCYLFSAELGKEHGAFMVDAGQDVRINDWRIDTRKLSEGGVEYVFSSVEIGNAQELSLDLEGVFESEGEFWKVYLYHLNESKMSIR